MTEPLALVGDERILITGAGGWLGRSLLSTLLPSTPAEQLMALGSRSRTLIVEGRPIEILAWDDADVAGFAPTHIVHLAYLTRDRLVELGWSRYVAENVGLAIREHTEKTDEEIAQICDEKLRMVGLEGVSSKVPAELSGGMKKRVGFARAIAMNPECVLYDEPTTGLDPIMSDVINNLIVKLSSELKITSVVVTHDLASAYKVGHRIAMLHDGVVIFQGTPDEIRETDHPLVRQFIEGRAEGPIMMGSGQ